MGAAGVVVVPYLSFVSGDFGTFAVLDAVFAAVCDLDGCGVDAVAAAGSARGHHCRGAGGGYFAMCSDLV
jgi:hypothetical protein